MALNGFIYTIAVYFMPFISHLAAFRTAFTTTPNLHQNKPARESIICDKVGDWWTKKGTHNVKIYTENQTKKNNSVAYTRMGNGTKNTFAYDRQHERLQSMLLMANEDSIMQTQK